MKLWTSICLLLLVAPLLAQKEDVLVLNALDSTQKTTLIQALQQRASTRAFGSSPLSVQHLSDLLWAGNGINRPAENKRTAPSAINAQDVDIYAFLPGGVYLYDPARHALKRVVAGDQRAVFGADASLPSAIFLLVSDLSRFSRGEDAQKQNWAAIDAGMVAQNMLLYSAAAQLHSRPRVSMDKDALRKLLALQAHQVPVLNVVIANAK